MIRAETFTVRYNRKPPGTQFPDLEVLLPIRISFRRPFQRHPSFSFWENRFSQVIPNLSTGFAGFSTWMSTAYPHESRLDIEEGGRSRIRPLAHLRFFLSLSSYSRHAASAALLCPHGFSIISRSNRLFVKYRNSSPFSVAKKAAFFQTAYFSKATRCISNSYD